MNNTTNTGKKAQKNWNQSQERSGDKVQPQAPGKTGTNTSHSGKFDQTQQTYKKEQK